MNWLMLCLITPAAGLLLLGCVGLVVWLCQMAPEIPDPDGESL